MKPDEINARRGAVFCFWRSQCFKSGSIFLQKPQSGFQKTINVEEPKNSASVQNLPSISGNENDGAGEFFRDRFCDGDGCGTWSLPSATFANNSVIAGAPEASGLYIRPSGPTTMAD